ncbi:hypothetical protein [Paenibacillus shenyangensis]|uniref:hypothetical protein n=1 Tax=Paenibacillus sp. A9 TaxID=1284352 RepID=UPI00037FA59A|nr:hypothetical protein [Paenibacillus sp. A9]
METALTLITPINQEITRQGYTLNTFSQASGINRGVLSATLNGHPSRKMSINQLDQMTRTLGKPEGWLYDSFIQNCFPKHGNPNWRRVKPLLVRCLELNHIKQVQHILSILTADSSSLSSIFKLAEDLSENIANSRSALLYAHIIEHEKDYQSERLAISHYRMYRFAIGDNLEQNLKLAFCFEPFLQHLPPPLVMEALMHLASNAYVMQDWTRIQNYGTTLHQLVTAIYAEECRKRTINPACTPIKTERPLVAYYGQSYLMRCISLEHQKQYEEAEKYLEGFTDLSWFEGLDEQGWKEVSKLKKYAMFNRYNLNLLKGNEKLLPEYFQLLEQYPDEVLPTILIALKASNIHDWNIDHLLQQYTAVIYPPDMIDNILSNQYYSLQSSISRYINIYYELALYHCNRNRYSDELANILSALEVTIEKHNQSRIMDCLKLLRKLRELTHQA